MHWLDVVEDAKTLSTSYKKTLMEQVFLSLGEDDQKEIASKLYNKTKGIEGYRLSNREGSIVLYSMQEILTFLLNNGVEKPHRSNVYKCIRGEAKSVYGFTIEKL